MLTPVFLGVNVLIHTGKSLQSFSVKNIHIGQKAGEFAATKVPAIFKRNKRKIGRIKYGP
jgi:ribosomal protein S19